MTKADVLSGFDKIRICKAYNINGSISQELPYDINTDIEPVYIEMDGWKEDITGIDKYGELPDSLKEYISYIEKETGIPVDIISVGPDRSETIIR